MLKWGTAIVCHKPFLAPTYSALCLSPDISTKERIKSQRERNKQEAETWIGRCEIAWAAHPALHCLRACSGLRVPGEVVSALASLSLRLLLIMWAPDGAEVWFQCLKILIFYATWSLNASQLLHLELNQRNRDLFQWQKKKEIFGLIEKRCVDIKCGTSQETFKGN